MAEITASELRKLLKELDSLRAQDRAAGYTDLSIRSQYGVLRQQLAPFAAAGFEDASAAIGNITLDIEFINERYAEKSAGLKTATQSAATDVAASPNGATQNPATPPTSTGRLTTDQAATLRNNTETGTNPPVKTLTETQSVPPANTGNTPSPEGRPSGEPGAASKGDDGTTAANTRQIISAATARQTVFQPRNNVLDQYASYTYNIGWYLLTPEQYTALQKTSKISVSQYNLLMQSGGAPAGTAGVQPELTTSGTVAGAGSNAGRNSFFGLDYYLDNLQIKSRISGAGTNRAHNAVELSFDVIETASITLIDNLYKAVKSVYKDSGIAYSSAFYALIIRFYGYDQHGKIVQASDSDNKNAVVEKIIPFTLKDIKFSVSNKLVEYRITAATPSYEIGFGSNLGVVKATHQISGATVKEILTQGATIVDAASSGRDGRPTTPAPATPGTPSPLSSRQGIQPVLGVSPVQADGTFNQNQADTLNLLAAGGMGA